MSLSIKQQIFTQNIARLIIYANSKGINLTFGEAYRTNDQQLLYRFGKNIEIEVDHLVLTPGTVKSKTMRSNHLRRLAVDFNFFIAGKLTYDHELLNDLGRYWEKMHPNNRWGGNFERFRDAPHFEMNVL